MGHDPRSVFVYGIKVDAEYLPWEGDNLEEWWQEKHGMDIESPYVEGELIEGKGDDDESEYFDKVGKWNEDNPCPYEQASGGGDEEPDIVVTMRGRVLADGDWNDPMLLDLDEIIKAKDCREELEEFIKEFNIPEDECEVGYWLLSDLW